MGLVFSGIAELVVAVAFGVHARSVGDSDTLVLTAYDVRIVQERRGKAQSHSFNRGMVRVGMNTGLDPLITLSSAGKTVAFGLGLRPAVRRVVCHQLQKDLPDKPASQCFHNLQAVLAQAGVRAWVQV